MKTTVKILCLLLLCALILPFAASCHGNGTLPVFEIPESFDESRKYEISFWAKNDTNKNQVRIYEKAISDFEALYPNINVTLRLYTDYSRIYKDVITNISTKTTPNICITYPDHIATYLTGVNTVVPLDGLFADEKYGLGGNALKFDSPSFDEMIPQFLNECSFSGYYYAVPFMRSTEACYINRDLVEALGYTVPDKLTWDFIWEVSDAACRKAEDGTYLLNGQKVMIPFIYKSTDNMMIQMTKQLGAGYSDSAGNIYLFNDDVKKQLFNIADHVRLGAFSTFAFSSYPGNFLNAGQCVFAIDSTAGSTWIGTDAPLSDISEDKLVRFETEVRAVPQFDPENPYMISQGPSVCIFNKEDPQEVMASWLFMQFLLTNSVQIAYAETEGYVPVTYKAQGSEEYIDYLSRGGEDTSVHYDVKIKATKLLIENVGHTFVTPVFNGSASLRSASGELIESVNKSVRRGETVDDEYMDGLFAKVTSLYHLDSIARQNAQSGEKAELGELPEPSVVLLAVIALAWLGIGAYFLVQVLKNKKKKAGD